MKAQNYAVLPGSEINRERSMEVGSAGAVVQTATIGSKTIKHIQKYEAVLKKYLLWDKVTTKQFMLTNSHVVNPDVENPSNLTIKTPRNGRNFGEVTYSYPIVKGSLNKLDCALIKAKSGYEFSTNVKGGIG